MYAAAVAPGRDPLLWYDGARRGREEVRQLVRRDALLYVRASVERYERDAEECRVLVRGLYRGLDVDPDDLSTGLSNSALQWRGEHLELTPPHHFRHLAPLIERRVAAASWCAECRLIPHRGGDVASIEISLAALPPPDVATMSRHIRAHAEESRAKVRRGAAALRVVVDPDPMPEVEAALAAAVDALSELEQAKLARLDRFG